VFELQIAIERAADFFAFAFRLEIMPLLQKGYSVLVEVRREGGYTSVRSSLPCHRSKIPRVPI